VNGRILLIEAAGFSLAILAGGFLGWLLWSGRLLGLTELSGG
jgi:hypothetical protein